MHLIVGGKYMGKLEYARGLYGKDLPVCDLAVEGPEKMFEATCSKEGVCLVVNLQEGVRRLLERGESVRDFFDFNLHNMKDMIVIGDEIGSGIVPTNPFERLWRDETGFLYQRLASEADIVDRVWAGLPFRLKGAMPQRSNG
jgi:adenosyl cobinamide kinase/adenosyl cobinamide phosphate guanylyltransferase